MELLLTQTHGRVRLLTLNRPDRDNRISEALARSLTAALDDAERDESIGAIVLAAAGGVFCLGGDHSSSGTDTKAYLAFSAAFADLTNAMLGCGKPLLAAINGNAHAGGFSLLTCCDLAVMSETATLALPELAHGLFPILAMATVQRAVPRKLFFELAYEGRLITAADAAALWLINETAPADQVLARTLERAARLADADASSLRLGRQGYNAMSRADLNGALEQARYLLPALIELHSHSALTSKD